MIKGNTTAICDACDLVMGGFLKDEVQSLIDDVKEDAEDLIESTKELVDTVEDEVELIREEIKLLENEIAELKEYICQLEVSESEAIEELDYWESIDGEADGIGETLLAIVKAPFKIAELTARIASYRRDISKSKEDIKNAEKRLKNRKKLLEQEKKYLDKCKEFKRKCERETADKVKQTIRNIHEKHAEAVETAGAIKSIFIEFLSQSQMATNTTLPTDFDLYVTVEAVAKELRTLQSMGIGVNAAVDGISCSTRELGKEHDAVHAQISEMIEVKEKQMKDWLGEISYIYECVNRMLRDLQEYDAVSRG